MYPYPQEGEFCDKIGKFKSTLTDVLWLQCVTHNVISTNCTNIHKQVIMASSGSLRLFLDFYGEFFSEMGKKKHTLLGGQ